ncbi:MAG: tyrosine-type recombinase/integrase, partial [Chloroflexota bacterium]|nr:tyrosine-type recombinase/integrase [Chloroflexota bacterium]
SIRGTPLQPSNFRQRVWERAIRHAGLEGEGYRFHDLRHTCVSRLVALGADVKLVQAVAGHANPMITLKRYSHLLDARITEAAGRFDPARVEEADTRALLRRQPNSGVRFQAAAA